MVPRLTIILWVIVLATVRTWAQLDITNNIKQCRMTNKKPMSTCVLDLLKDLTPYFKSGLPSYGLPSMDPFQIDAVEYSEKNQLMSVWFRATKISARGLSRWVPQEIDVNQEKRTMFAKIRLPQLRITGQYNLSGNALGLPVYGNGKFWAVLKGIQGSGLMQFQEHKATNRGFISQTQIEFQTPADVKFKLTNFMDDDVIADTVIKAMNDNREQLINVLRPRIKKEVGENLTQILNIALRDIPYELYSL